jgi:ABC-type polysaccharide/polyol phosphate export permease
MVAVAGAVWLLFANTVSQAGMSLWHERRLLRDDKVRPGLLLAAAAVVPLTLFAIQMVLVHLAVAIHADHRGAGFDDVVLAGGIAFATGLGIGILVARLVSLRPNMVPGVPQLLTASFLLTPVLYRLAALKDAAKLWCTINPLAAAAELARRNITHEPSALPKHAAIIAICASGVVLLWGVVTTRVSLTAGSRR